MLKRLLIKCLDGLQKSIARSKHLVNITVLIRNQGRCIIKYHLAESPNVANTGEVWLQKAMIINNGTYIDVGANVGEWIEGLFTENQKLSCTIVAYEPSESALAKLREKFNQDSRVKIIPAALGEIAGRKIFNEEKDAGKGSTFVSDFFTFQTTAHEVDVLTLDGEVEKLNITFIDMLKIDAEGYDYLVLKGAIDLIKNKSIGVIQFEYNRSWQLTGSTLYSAMDCLSNSGYRTFVLKKEGLYTLNYIKYEEYFEYTNFVAISPGKMDLFKDKIKGVI